MPRSARLFRAILSTASAAALASCAATGGLNGAAPVACGAAAAASVPSTTPALPTPPAMNEALLRAVTTRLSSDEFAGRGPNTAGETLTIAYIIEQMRAAGLQPGNNGSWTQDVPLAAMRATHFSPLSFTTPRGTQSLTIGEDFVANSFRMAPHTAINNSDVVFVGYGINAPEKGWNDYAGVDVRGKTVLILINDPDWQTPT
ncbi:MAG: peptidase M28, partial [Sphingopyxis sp.]